MLSFGIRFGQGFDRSSVIKIMQSVPSIFDYDLIVLGCNPGGIACAKEASIAGKKAAIIKWKTYTPAEEEGFDEDLKQIANALDVQVEHSVTTVESVVPDEIISNSSKMRRKFKSSTYKSWTSVSQRSAFNRSQRGSYKTTRNSRGVRKSRLDLNNEFFKRGQKARKLMHNAAVLQYAIEDARNGGWRISSASPTINWNKMTDQVMDFVMKENWDLTIDLNEKKIEVIEGSVAFINNHTVKVLGQETGPQEMTAEIICIAASSEYIFPRDIRGAAEFGISCDDFIRLEKAPGKTLIVGNLPEGLECAGIAALCQNPVTVVPQAKVLNTNDSEISQLIKNDLKTKGIIFLEDRTLKSIDLTPNNKLLATFQYIEPETTENPVQVEFDTVVFAVGKETPLKFLKLENAGIELDPVVKRIRTNEREETQVENIYAVGDCVCMHPDSFEIAELAGKLLGRRLFKEETEVTDYSMAPFVIYTPVEYAYIGLSEDAALLRLGEECVNVYRGYFKPIDFALSPKHRTCLAKIIALRSEDKIIGLHFYGPEAGEVIQGFAAAVKIGVTMKQLQSVVGVHATKAQEILKLK